MFIEYLLGASCCVRHLTFMILLSNHIIWGKFLSQLCRWENRGSERLLKVTGLLTEEGSGFEFRVGSLMLPVLVACWALWLLGSCGQHREKCPMFLWHNFIIRIFRTPHGLFKSCCSFAVKAAHCGQVVVDVGADVALSLMGFCWEAHLPHVLGLSSLWAFGEYLNSSLPLNQWQLFQKSFSSGHKVNSQFWAGCPLNCDCPMFSVPLEGWKTTCSVSIHTAITKIPWVGWWGSGVCFSLSWSSWSPRPRPWLVWCLVRACLFTDGPLLCVLTWRSESWPSWDSHKGTGVEPSWPHPILIASQGPAS